MWKEREIMILELGNTELNRVKERFTVHFNFNSQKNERNVDFGNEQKSFFDI